MNLSLRAAVCVLGLTGSGSGVAVAQDALTLSPSADRRDPAGVENSIVIGPDSFQRRVTLLPHGLLWKPPLANQEAPRSYMKLQALQSDDFSSINDCAIGGTFPLVRFSRLDKPNEGIQTDLFAAAFSRFEDVRTFAAVDYRFGVPFTYKVGNLSLKLGYEHTSCHLGDEYLVMHNAVSRDSTRNEVVFGASYQVLEPLRVYGQFGYALGESTFVEHYTRERYDCGVEWSKPGPTGVWGQPYAAIDCEFRGDEDYTPNFSAQVGWQWQGMLNSPDFRVAVEYYDGRSPFGQFIDRHESWTALGFFFDF
jgi:hypothetical protein